MTDLKMYQVGGSVRDELLGIKSKDIDFAVEAPSFEYMKDYLLKEGYEIYLEQAQYFTIRAQFPKDKVPPCGTKVVDFTLCRKESHYSDGRRPDTVTVAKLADDLARRDFTVNAMAKALDGSLIDPFNGQQDLTDRRLRCVGSAHERLAEDALRGIRALRFVITKGFKMDTELKEALHSDWFPPLLQKISIERVREELSKAFSHDTLGTLRMLHEFSDEFLQATFRNTLVLQPHCRFPKVKKTK